MGTRRDVASRRSAPSGHVATTTLQRGPFSRCQKVPFLLAISRGHYSSFLAHTGSCVRPSPSRRLGGPSYAGSLQVVASPCWGMALPDIISAILA